MNQLDQIDIYKRPHIKTAKYTFLSKYIFLHILYAFHTLDHKTNLKNFKRIKIIEYIL